MQDSSWQVTSPHVYRPVSYTHLDVYKRQILEPLFHEDSYGYRPNKSAIDAVGMARQRCWKYDYVIDLDIKGMFDNIDHELLMKACLLYTSRCV